MLGKSIALIRLGAVVVFLDFSGQWFGIDFTLPCFMAGLESVFWPEHLLDGRLGIGFPYVFNIADAGITVGAILLLIDQFLLKRHVVDAR